MEISERRKYLLPKLDDATKHGRRARLQNDKLFIEGPMLNRRPPPPGPPVEIHRFDHPQPQHFHSDEETPHRPRYG